MIIDNKNTATTFDQHHKQRKQRNKPVVDASIAQATEERGIILVHTANGKDKNSAAFAMVARAQKGFTL